LKPANQQPWPSFWNPTRVIADDPDIVVDVEGADPHWGAQWQDLAEKRTKLPLIVRYRSEHDQSHVRD
jgi:hypothetical protein